MKRTHGFLALAASALIVLASCGASDPITKFATGFKNGDSKATTEAVGGSYSSTSSDANSSDEVSAYIWKKTVAAKTVKVGDGTHTDASTDDNGNTTPEKYTYAVTVEGYSYATLAAKYLASKVGTILGANGWTKDNVDTELKSMTKSTNSYNLTTYKDADKGWVLEAASATILSAALLA